MKRRALALATVVATVLPGCVPGTSANPTPGQVGLAISASDIEFIPDTLVAPARASLDVQFHNHSNEPHTLIFLEPISLNPEQVVQPGQMLNVSFVAPAAGEYVFVCNVHEGMTGTLRVT